VTVKKLAILYKVSVVLGLALYGAAELTGYRIAADEPEQIDPSIRSSPGGYRSFHFWHTGFSGGK
jgi:hypothetical protein